MLIQKKKLRIKVLVRQIKTWIRKNFLGLAVMKFEALCVLVATYLAVPCFSEPFIMELPGYAKTVLGGFGEFLHLS